MSVIVQTLWKVLPTIVKYFNVEAKNKEIIRNNFCIDILLMFVSFKSVRYIYAEKIKAVGRM